MRSHSCVTCGLVTRQLDVILMVFFQVCKLIGQEEYATQPNFPTSLDGNFHGWQWLFKIAQLGSHTAIDLIADGHLAS